MFIEPARPPLTPVARPSISSSSALRIDAERQRVPVAAVGRGDAVAILEDARDADRNGLLARVEVRRPVDLAAEEERLDQILEAADQDHRPVEPEVELGLPDDGKLVGHVAVAPRSAASAA